MSEDKQLTVAELLARAGSENRDGAASRPRRRRSLDDGGVSVAELTGSLKKVEAQPAESKHSSVPLDAPAEPEKPAEKPEPEQTEPEQTEPEQPAAQTEPEQPAEEEQPVEEKQPELGEGGRQGVEKRAAVAEDDTSVIGVVPGPEDTGVMPAVKEREEGSTAVAAAEAPAEDEEDGSINPFMLVLLVLLGLAAGVGGFLGFQWIWANTQTVVAALIALVVVVAIVFGVRALRTGRDAVTMLLAGVAGAVMAFGPALIV